MTEPGTGEREGSDERCNCMVLFNPVLAPHEHHDDCPLHHGTMQWRATSNDRPQSWWDDPEQDGLWEDDRLHAVDVANLLRDLGSMNVRIVHRIHLAPSLTTTGEQAHG